MPFAYMQKTIPGGVAGTMATVEEIARLIKQGTRNPRVRLQAIEIVRGLPWKDRSAEAKAIFRWIKQEIRFVYDPEGAELVQDVDAILEHKAADCDDMTVIGGALLRSIGIPARIVIIASDPTTPNAFSHIYLQALVNGGWTGFDPSVIGSDFGWEPDRFMKKRVIHLNDED